MRRWEWGKIEVRLSENVSRPMLTTPLHRRCIYIMHLMTGECISPNVPSSIAWRMKKSNVCDSLKRFMSPERAFETFGTDAGRPSGSEPGDGWWQSNCFIGVTLCSTPATNTQITHCRDFSSHLSAEKQDAETDQRGAEKVRNGRKG